MNAAPATAADAQEPVRRPPATRQTSKRQDAPAGLLAHLNGYLVIHTHRLAPHGDIVGGRIPTSKAEAVKMAVTHLWCKASLDPEIAPAFAEQFDFKNYPAALALWSEFQQRRALEFRSSEDGDPPERIDILELPIDLPE